MPTAAITSTATPTPTARPTEVSACSPAVLPSGEVSMADLEGVTAAEVGTVRAGEADGERCTDVVRAILSDKETATSTEALVSEEV